MPEPIDLESLCTQAQQAIAAKEYDRARDLLKRIVVEDVEYKDASKLLAQLVALSRRRWYNDPRLWGAVGIIMLVVVGILIASALRALLTVRLTETPTTIALAPTVTPTSTPTLMSPLTPKAVPSGAPTRAPTAAPFAWKRISVGQEFARALITAIVIDPLDPEVLYVGTETAGIYKSVDGGISWQPAHYGLGHAVINCQGSRHRERFRSSRVHNIVNIVHTSFYGGRRDEKQERRWRRLAIRLWLRGFSDRYIQRQVPRSLGWLDKWQKRYEHSGWDGLKSQSRCPQHTPHYPETVRQVVVRVRRKLAKRKVGRLVGARAIEREIRRGRLLPFEQRPSRATIKRILHENHLVPYARRKGSPCYPQPTPTQDYIIQAMDWVARYLEGGAKCYAFHSLDLAIRDLSQSLRDNKRGATAEAHALET